MPTPISLHARIKMRASTDAEWTADNPTLLAREIGIVLPGVAGPDGSMWHKAKIGPGQWSALPYIALGDGAGLQDAIDQAVADHVAATDPHGDRAYADTLVSGLASEGYVDSAVADEAAARDAAIANAKVGLWNDRGSYDASTNTFPAAGGSGAGGAILKGDVWTVSVVGTLGGAAVDIGDTVRAVVDNPGNVSGYWAIAETNTEQATEVERGTLKVVSMATIQDNTTTNDVDAVTAKKWWQGWAKGLTLSSFFGAVRGVTCSGLSAVNAAVTATDTIIQAIGKLQGQVTNRLVKSSNLSDVANVTTARNNLGLKGLAVQDYADAIIYRTPMLMGEPVAFGDIVVVMEDGLVWKATPANSATRRIFIVCGTPSGYAQLQLSGIIPIGGLSPGSAYYLRPSAPGAITDERNANAIYVGTAITSNHLDFRPALPLSSGRAYLAADESTSVSAGIMTSLATGLLVPGAIYEIHVWAKTSAESGAGRARLWLDAGGVGACMGDVTIQDGSSNIVGGYFISSNLFAPMSDATVVGEGAETAAHLRAILAVDEHYTGVCSVMLGPLNDGVKAHLRAGSTITWNRIG
jgi:hypothetical protein